MKLIRLAALPAVVTASLLLAAPVQATFPGSNGRIAFSGFPGPGSSDLFSVEPNGNGLKNLTHSAGVGEASPSYSADGKRIVFSQGSGALDAHIWVMHADGSHKRELTKGHHTDNHPAFSPSGRRIVFERGGGIFTMHADGSRIRRLTNGDGNFRYDYQPTWSPTGKLIAYNSNHAHIQSAATDIWTMHPDGSHKRALMETKNVFDISPEFSADGQTIDYAREQNGHIRVYHIDKDASANHGATQFRIKGAHSDQNEPARSPDGKRLAFRGVQSGGMANGLFTFLLGSGGNATAIPLGMVDLAGEPSWQPK